MAERKRMGRSVYFGYYLDASGGSFLLETDEFLLRVVAIAGGQARKSFTFQSESRIRPASVIVEVTLESIVVQVYMENVHFVVR